MTDRLAIAFAQLNQVMGDLAHNAEIMLGVHADCPEADLVVFPELQLIGYPPEDLVLKRALVERAAAELDRMAQSTTRGGPAMLVGTVIAEGDKLYNAMALLDGGEIAAVTRKRELPNYGTFDEVRLFDPGPMPDPIEFRGVKLGVPICEDIWVDGVCAHLKERGAEMFLVPNGSPYEVDKDDVRLALARGRVANTGLPLAYLNRVGGQDELVFDGSSFILNKDGDIAWQFADWEEEIATTVWERGKAGWECTDGPQHRLDDHPADIYHAMLVGLRDYVERNRFPGVVIGLSGGIDSALSAAVAVDALGADRVWCVMMPSRFTSEESLEDAAECARMLGCRLDTIPINPAVEAFDTMLEDNFADLEVDITEENIQARIRGVTLMALSNKHGHMVLTTGNKSEMAVGYATLYGDMNGGYSVLKDAYKTTVFDLSRFRNQTKPSLALGPDGPVMPGRVITKPPSAELRPDQKDEDSLPPYEVLDGILKGLVEEEVGGEELIARGFDKATVARIERLLYIAEYKRRQAPPGVKIGVRNFGRDRRYPITNAFRSM
jgi:NAD+ synthase